MRGTIAENEASAYQEKVLAQNAAALVRGHRGLAFLWASNRQIARQSHWGPARAGQHLARSLGRAYVSIASLAATGEFLAVDETDNIVIPHALPAPSPELFEHAMLSIATVPTTVDLLRHEDARAMLRAWPTWTRDADLRRTTDRNTRLLRNLGQAFDLLLFVPNSHAPTLTADSDREVGPGRLQAE
jgi:erythromycin esterase-like protein